MSDAPTDGLLARTLREEAGPLVARLSRRYGDFDLDPENYRNYTEWKQAGEPPA